MKSNSKGLDSSVMASMGQPQSSLEAVGCSVPAGGLDFGYCAVSLETKREFTLANVVPRSVTPTTVRYSIETDSPNFTVSHSNGVLSAGKK